MPVDAVLRLGWVLTIAPSSFGITIQTDLLNFCLSIAEITRRFIWNFFRMENEAATNCGKFRAVLEVPLPYDLDDDENGHAASRTLATAPNEIVQMGMDSLNAALKTETDAMIHALQLPNTEADELLKESQTKADHVGGG